MEEIYRLGKAKAIGVSNYMISLLEDMKRYAKIPPSVNQVEFHPFLYQKDLLEYCNKEGIVLEAHSPFAEGKGLENESIKIIAKKYGKTVTQVMLRWSMQHGAVPIPKSTHKERIEENINIFDFEIGADDMKVLDGLNMNLHVRFDPANFK